MIEKLAKIQDLLAELRREVGYLNLTDETVSEIINEIQIEVATLENN